LNDGGYFITRNKKGVFTNVVDLSKNRCFNGSTVVEKEVFRKKGDKALVQIGNRNDFGLGLKGYEYAIG